MGARPMQSRVRILSCPQPPKLQMRDIARADHLSEQPRSQLWKGFQQGLSIRSLRSIIEVRGAWLPWKFFCEKI